MSITREGINKHREVFDAWVDGAEVEIFVTFGIKNSHWFPCGDEQCFFVDREYRIKATPDYIDWPAVHPVYRYMIRSREGAGMLLKTKPRKPDNVNLYWRIDNEDKATTINPKIFSSYKQGTCDWKDSLQERPND